MKQFKGEKIAFLMLLFLSSFLTARELTQSEELLKWKQFQFKKYSDDSINHIKFFNYMKNDFFPGGINLKDSNDLETVNAYLVLRNSWIESPNIDNLRMSILITRCILILVIEYNTIDGISFFVSDSTLWGNLFQKTYISKNVLINSFDKIMKKNNSKWKSLKEFDSVATDSNKITKGWLKYIKQANLFYKKFYMSGGNSRILTDSKSVDQFSKLRHMINFIKEPKLTLDLQIIACTVDQCYFLKLVYPYVQKVGNSYNNTDCSKFIVQHYSTPEVAGLFLNGMGNLGGELIAMLRILDITDRKSLVNDWENTTGIYLDDLF